MDTPAPGTALALHGPGATAPQSARESSHGAAIAFLSGTTTLGFQAQEFVGGCNVGRVVSWGGKVTVTVTFR